MMCPKCNYEMITCQKPLEEPTGFICTKCGHVQGTDELPPGICKEDEHEFHPHPMFGPKCAKCGYFLPYINVWQPNVKSERSNDENSA